MPNLLESSQTTATTAPDYYNTHLSNLATKGETAASGAKYIGAQPLQEQAFKDVAGEASAYKPTLDAAGNTLTSATGVTSPLSAATGYLSQATSDPSKAAQNYMSPYIQSVVNALGDTGQRNIQQNLSPLATAGAVGGGQFGSKRGAEVLGQTISNADRDILNSQYTALNTGYSDALKAAIQQNQTAATAGNTAANAASSGQQNLISAGKAQSDLAGQNQTLGLANINALATMGEQQQTIKQNEQLFPLQNLTTEAALLRGYNVPTTTKTTAQASPLSIAAGLGTGMAGFVTPKYDSLGKAIAGSSPFDQLKKAYGFGTAQTSPDATTEVENTANPGQEGYGWRNFSDGTSIDPQGNYYKNGELIYSPGADNGGSGDTVEAT